MINQIQERLLGIKERKKKMIQPVAEEITQPCDALYDFVSNRVLRPFYSPEMKWASQNTACSLFLSLVTGEV